MRYESIFAVCFTRQGRDVMGQVRSALSALCAPEFSVLCAFGPSHRPLCDFVRESFDVAHSGKKTLLIFVGACGIAVRSIAPFLEKKTVDPAVLCVDDGGRFVIPVLSGHIGGANEAAKALAGSLGATPVITTSTDVNGAWAYDSWCVGHGKKIKNTDVIKDVASRVLRGEKIFSVGVGCKKGTDSNALAAFIQEVFFDNDLDFSLLRSVSSIDVKKNERAILDFARAQGVSCAFYSSGELNMISGDFSSSAFVRERVGVDCVCERAAVASSMHSELLVGKCAFSGMTVAIAL
ncbi:MAG: cobalamin biosynthesis protein [Treponema sp.]|nr:cobalamin biosynthesis protein [Treponema sp.]